MEHNEQRKPMGEDRDLKKDGDIYIYTHTHIVKKRYKERGGPIRGEGWLLIGGPVFKFKI